MKKICVVVILLMFVSSGLFAMERTVGGGLLYNLAISNLSGSETFEGESFSLDADLTRNGFGAFGFYGISQFWEVNFGFLYKNPSKVKVTETFNGVTNTYEMSGGLDSVLALQLGVYYKYPIPVSDTLVFFPTGGVDFEFTLGGDGGAEAMDWWHDLWLRAGVGLDAFLNERMFIRSHLIYGASIPFGGDVKPLELGVGHGLLIKVGLGWML